MNATMLNTAGGLIGITHSYLGEKWILMPMYAQYKLPVLRGSDRATKNVMRFAWHLTSVAWWGLGAILFVIASPAPNPLACILRVIAITFAIHAVVTAASSRFRHYAWIVFGAIAVLAWLGIASPKAEAGSNFVAAAQRCKEGHKTYDQWHSKLVIPFESPISSKTWAERYLKVSVGSSPAEVVQQLGEPDYVEAAATKENNPARYLGCSWQYNVKLLDDNVNYRDNGWIGLFFGPDGRLQDKDAVNIAGIPNRPLPQSTK